MRTRVQDAKLMHSSHPQLAVRVPALSPSSMLDFGSGPGTAALVAAAVWPQACSELVCVEPSPHMRSLADSLQAAVSSRQSQASPPPCRFISALDRLRGPEQQRRYDLVIAAYSIGELPTRTARQQAIRRLWAHTRDVLVIVEPGTPKASTHVREARQDVLDLARRALRAQDKLAHAAADVTPDDSSVHVVAPCAHEKRCPAEDMTATWCHFAQRVQRTTAQRVSNGVSNVWSHQVRASCVFSVRD
jgi:ribosomal protein RSM22 (predicted rRNA methylase)